MPAADLICLSAPKTMLGVPQPGSDLYGMRKLSPGPEQNFNNQIELLKKAISGVIASDNITISYDTLSLNDNKKIDKPLVLDIKAGKDSVGTITLKSEITDTPDDTLNFNIDLKTNYVSDKLENVVNNFINALVKTFHYTFMQSQEAEEVIPSIIPSKISGSSAEKRTTMERSSAIDSYSNDCKKYAPQNKKIPKHQKDNHVIRIMTYNVCQWKNPSDDKSNYQGIIKMINEINPDILILQEATLFDKKAFETSQITNDFHRLGYTSASFCDAGGSWTQLPYGNIIFSKYPFKEVISKTFNADLGEDEKRCYIRATLELPGQKDLTLFGVHLDAWDNSGKKRSAEIQEIIEATQAQPERNYIIAGDFNSVRAEDYDYKINDKKAWNVVTNITKAITHLPPSTAALDLLKQYGFVDSFSKNNMPAPFFTAWTGTAVDFIYLNNKFRFPVLGSYVYYNAQSDHLPIITDIKIA